MATNLDVVRGIYEAFGQGDIPAVLTAFAPDVNWTEAEGFPYGGVTTGPDAVLQNVFMKLGTEWEGWTAVPEKFVAQDDMVVALGMYGGTYKATGKSISVPFTHAWTLKDGKVVRFQQYTDTAVVQKALR